MTVLPRTLLGLLLASAAVCPSPQDPPPASISIEDGRATVRGIVRENVKRCQVDGPCYLLLDAEPAGVRIYYHHGENPPCPNQRSTSTGMGVTAGDAIEATGLYSRIDRTHTLDVCCDTCTLTITRRP
jgi:hypothetical protein